MMGDLDTSKKNSLRMQQDLVLAIASTRDTKEALQHVLAIALNVDGVDAGGIYFTDENDRTLRLIVHQGLSQQFIDEVSSYGAESDQARLVRAGKAVYDSSESFSFRDRRILKREGLRALGVIPISYLAEVEAVFNLASREHDVIPTRTQLLLEEFAGFIGTIVARLKTESAARQSQDNLTRFLGAIDDFVFVLDDRGNVILANDAVHTRLGYSHDELVGKPVLHVHPRHLWPDAEAMLDDLRSDRHSVCSIPVAAKDGSLIPVETKITRGQWNGRPAFFGVSRDITKRQQAEQDLLAEQRFLRRLLDLQERERRMVSHDIHDGFVQDVVGAKLRVDNLLSRVGQAAGSEHPLANVSQLLGKAIDDARQTINWLRPMPLDGRGVADAISDLTSNRQFCGDASVEVLVDLPSTRLSDELEATAFRIVQESLTNCIRHSKADTIEIAVVEKGNLLEVTVKDSGIGFNVDSVPDDRLGLIGIHERARLFGGTASIESEPGSGTVVRVTLPIDRTPAANLAQPLRNESLPIDNG
jgi:PAS domain S-box-containing protein